MAPETIRVDGSNGAVVFIRAKRIQFGLRNKILSTAAQMCGSGGAVPDRWAVANATIQHYIVSWSGVQFPPYREGMLFPAEALDELDDVFANKILDTIDTLSPKTDPNSPTATESGDGSPDSEAQKPPESESGTNT